MCAAVYVNIFFVAFPILFLLYLFRGIPSCLEKDNNYRKRRQSIEKNAEEKIELLYIHRPCKIRDYSTPLWYIFWQFGRQNIFVIRFGYIVYAVLLVLPEAGGVEAAAGQEDESPRGQTPAVSALSGRQSWNCVHIFAGWREKKKMRKIACIL